MLLINTQGTTLSRAFYLLSITFSVGFCNVNLQQQANVNGNDGGVVDPSGGSFYIDEESLIDTLFQERGENRNNKNNGGVHNAGGPSMADRLQLQMQLPLQIQRQLHFGEPGTVGYGIQKKFGYRPTDPRFWMDDGPQFESMDIIRSAIPGSVRAGFPNGIAATLPWDNVKINWDDLLGNNNEEQVNEEAAAAEATEAMMPQQSQSQPEQLTEDLLKMHDGKAFDGENRETYIMKKDAEMNYDPKSSHLVQGNAAGNHYAVPGTPQQYAYGGSIPGNAGESPGDNARMLSPYYIGLITGSTIVGVVVIVGAGICYYKVSARLHSTADVDYPAYGVTGPIGGSSKSPTGEHGSGDFGGGGGMDTKLASSAHMYHYQHQKQQMQQAKHGCLEKEGGHGGTTASGERIVGGASDDEDDGDEDGDYTVYECPGFAAGGDMEVKNPLFAGTSDDLSVPMSPACAIGDLIGEEAGTGTGDQTNTKSEKIALPPPVSPAAAKGKKVGKKQ